MPLLLGPGGVIIIVFDLESLNCRKPLEIQHLFSVRLDIIGDTGLYWDIQLRIIHKAMEINIMSMQDLPQG